MDSARDASKLLSRLETQPLSGASRVSMSSSKYSSITPFTNECLNEWLLVVSCYLIIRHNTEAQP